MSALYWDEVLVAVEERRLLILGDRRVRTRIRERLIDGELVTWFDVVEVVDVQTPDRIAVAELRSVTTTSLDGAIRTARGWGYTVDELVDLVARGGG